ncbi:MAG: peptidoglycan DD-metalloendopeptidase family protein [Leptolyngbyaceae cyanobacterium MO_188.B28]|nr:peptidoglycan DD-metalloendopeptidase family protein [Leptolyngbyaceae cyanobacterium MO_188.B28]
MNTMVHPVSRRMSDFETVKRWLLGGFSLKRAFPQEPKPCSSFPLVADLSDELEDQEKFGFSGGKRRVRTSAAMLGLALSMGASGALLPGHDDATAAEPPSPNLSLATAPLGLPTASSSVSDAVPEVSQPTPQLTAYHTVEAGQTLWQIADIHQVDIQDIKTANGIQADTILQVGQVLRVPTDLSSRSSQLALTGSVPSDDSVADTAQNLSLSVQQVTALGELSQSPSKIDSDLSWSASEQSFVSAVPGQLTLDPDSPEQLGTSEFEEIQATLRPSSDRFATEQLTPEFEASSQSDNTGANAAQLSGYVDSAAASPDFAETIAKASLQDSVSTQGQPLKEELSQPSIDPIDLGLLSLNPNPQEAPVSSDGQLSAPAGAAIEGTFQTPLSSAPNLERLKSTASPSPEFSLQASPEVSYQIRQGDTLASIASSHGISIEQLAGANGIVDPNFIVAGDALTIPEQNSIGAESYGAAPVELSIERQPEVAEPMLMASVGSSVFESPSEQASQDNRLSRLQQTVINREGNVSKLLQQQSLLRTSNASSETTFAPQAIQFDQVEAAVAEAQVSEPIEATPSVSDSQVDPYMANLLNEVRSIQLSPTNVEGDVSAALPQGELSPDVALASSSAPESVPVNPEFSSRGGAAPAQVLAANPEGRSLDSSQASQLLAAAPLGSETYAPLNPTAVQRVVSPDMPVLPGQDEFLPEAPNTFNGYSWPTTGIITSGYGWRWGRMHRGVDIAGPVGTPIVAAAAGVVESAGWNSGGYGNLVDIRHADGSLTRYAHNSRLLVQRGQYISQGQQIAEMGSTGYSTGPHLHFEVHLPNQGTVNPIAYLPNSR